VEILADEKWFMEQSEPATDHSYYQAPYTYKLNVYFCFPLKETGQSALLSQEFGFMPVPRNRTHWFSGIPYPSLSWNFLHSSKLKATLDSCF
jgi:hypothetical protein